jgi:hypothetical protein
MGTIMNEPETYEIRVAGHLSTHWAARFEPLDLELDPNGETVLTGMLDQAALHGALLQIRNLGLKIISVKLTKSDSNEEKNNE